MVIGYWELHRHVLDAVDEVRAQALDVAVTGVLSRVGWLTGLVAPGSPKISRARKERRRMTMVTGWRFISAIRCGNVTYASEGVYEVRSNERVLTPAGWVWHLRTTG